MHVRYSFSRLLLGLCLFALAPFQVAHAGFKNGQWSSGWNLDWDSGYMAPTPQWMPAGIPSTGNTTWGVSGGLPTAAGYGRLPLGNQGVVLDVEARTLPTRPSVASALGKFARKVGPVAQGLAVIELAMDLGFLFNPDGTVERSDPTVCTVAPCYTYKVNNLANTAKSSAELSCRQYVDNLKASQPTWNIYYISSSETVCTYQYNSSALNGSISKVSASPSPPSYLPSSYDDFETAVRNKTDWPDDSKLPLAIKEAADSGEPIDAPEPTLTGPASKAGPTTTTTNPDGTTTTKTTTYNVTYNGDQITYQTIVITNNNGQITTETSGPEPPPDQCAKYPDTLGCASLGNPETSSLKSSNHAVTVTPVSFASAAGCPAPLTFNVGPSAYSISYQPACDRLALLRVLFLAIAAVLAAFILADSFRVT